MELKAKYATNYKSKEKILVNIQSKGLGKDKDKE